MNLIRNDATTWTMVVIGVVSAAIFAVGEICNWAAASANGALILVSLLYMFLAMPLVARELVLLVGVIPGTVAVFATWIPVALTEVERPEFVILLPLPLVAAFLLSWTPVAFGLFYFTRRWSVRPALGPFTETVAMSVLLLPWLLAAVAFPSYMEQHNETVAVIIAISIGLLWSKLVSDPFARFVRAML